MHHWRITHYPMLGYRTMLRRSCNLLSCRAGDPARRTILRDNKEPPSNSKPVSKRNVAGLLKLIWNWPLVFRGIPGSGGTQLGVGIWDWRNKWTHQDSISRVDAYRMLDPVGRLLVAISVPVEKLEASL